MLSLQIRINHFLSVTNVMEKVLKKRPDAAIRAGMRKKPTNLGLKGCQELVLQETNCSQIQICFRSRTGRFLKYFLSICVYETSSKAVQMTFTASRTTLKRNLRILPLHVSLRTI